MMQPLILVDSFAQIFRCFYAIRSLSNRAGMPTNAIFAMTRFLLQLEERFPDCPGAFVFDTGRPPHRLKLAPAYKANRPPAPEDLLRQLPVIRDLISAFGWHSVEAPETEADDLIASIASAFSTRPVRIVSADKDLAQLVGGNVEMFVPDPSGKGFTRRGPEEVLEKFGVPPEAIVDYLALVGDASDNIPGIPGVGPKTAVQLLRQFSSIETMLQRTGEIARESLREKIAGGRELLNTNIALVKLVTEPPQGIVWAEADFRKTPPDTARIRAIAKEMELRSLLKEIESLEKTAGPPRTGGTDPQAGNGPEQLTLF